MIILALLLTTTLLMFSWCIAQQVPPVTSGKITVLPAAFASLNNGLQTSPLQTGRDTKIFAVQGWKDTSQVLAWTVKADNDGAYIPSLLLEVKGLSKGSKVIIQASRGKHITRLTSGNTAWNKLLFDQPIALAKGDNRVELKLANVTGNGHPELNVYAIELATAKTRAKNDADALALKSKPDWLNSADYGLFFHWNSRSKPRTGEPKNYSDAVRNFDVTRFAKQVHDMGARFMVLTTSWGGFTFPAPLKSVESTVPGSTVSRDLVADLSDALTPYNIRLLVYCNFRLDRMGLTKDQGIYGSRLDSAFSRMEAIYYEIGERYKDKIAGFWIDDGMAMYPYNAPFERLTRAMKHANKNMVVCYNSWIYPRFTDFQDFFGGEFGINLKAAGAGNDNLPVGGNGYFISGGQKGLKATFCGQLEKDDWTHTDLNKPISPPVVTIDQLTQIMKEAISRKNVAVMNVSVYQDGTVSDETLTLLKQLQTNIRQ